MHSTNGETRLRETVWSAPGHMVEIDKPELILKCDTVCTLGCQAANNSSEEMQDQSSTFSLLFLLLLFSFVLF